MRVYYTRSFLAVLEHLNPKLKKQLDERMVIFQKNPHDPMLNNHALQGRWKGKRSINITGDWRAVYYLIEGVIYFSDLGRHTDLYK